MISWHFAHCVKTGTRPSILPSQVKKLEDVPNGLSTGDLICVMYHGRDDVALKALQILRGKFED